jgi:hypothetical protein
VLRRQYVKAFGGMAVIVVLGALFGKVDPREGAWVAGLLLLLPAIVVVDEWRHWRRLLRRLGDARLQVQGGRKS